MELCYYLHFKCKIVKFKFLIKKLNTIYWLKSLPLSPIDRIILNKTLSSIESIDNQIEIVSKEIAKYAWQDSQDVKILLSMTGIDIFSAILISTEIVDIKRFATPWKLVSYAGLSPSTRESSGKTKTGRITKQGSPLLRWILYSKLF